MPKKRDKKKRTIDDTQSEGSVIDSSEDHSECSSCSSPPSPLTCSPPKQKGRGSLLVTPEKNSSHPLERRRSEVIDKETSNGSGHRRSNPSIFSSPSYSSPSSSLSSSSSSSGTTKKKKLSFFSPNVLANHPNTPPPSSHKGLLTHFDYHSDDVATITRYLVCLYIRDEREEINFFFCAFSNVGVDKVALFLHLKQLFEEKSPQKESEAGEKKKSLDKQTNKQIATTRKAIAHLLKVWMALSSALYDLQHQKLFQTVVEFVRLDDDVELNPLRLMLIKGKSKSQMDSELPLMRSITTGSLADGSIEKDKYFQPQLFCKGRTVLEIANTLTFVMFRVFKSIGPAELHDGAWQGKNKSSTGPHLHALSLLFNRIAFLCVIEILYAPTDDLRADALLKCVELAMALERMNNFEGMAAITSVFSAAPIQRLKPLWSAIGSKMSKKAKKLEDLLQPVKNYKAYHAAFNSREAPILPWLAPKLRELRFMYDGNPRENSDGTINYQFLMMMGKTIHDHLKFKDTEFMFKDEEGMQVKLKENLVAVLEDVLTLDQDYVEDTLYEKSMAIYSKK